MEIVKTEVLDPVVKISDHELYVNNSNVIDIKSGHVLFAFDTIPISSVPVGSDHIAFVKDNKLQIINWRSSIRETKRWYNDRDGDGFGDASTTMAFFRKPDGFVSNASDCNDLDSSVNPDTKWYKDGDGDRFGDASTFTASCTQPMGYIKDNTDCDDSNKDLTPQNLCVITAVENQVSDLSVFPSPGPGIYYVKHNGGFSEIKIINRVGQLINPEIVKGDEFYVIDITKETEGLYILNIQSGDANVHMKIIKH
jgi:hypothetical protein